MSVPTGDCPHCKVELFDQSTDEFVEEGYCGNAKHRVAQWRCPCCWGIVTGRRYDDFDSDIPIATEMEVGHPTSEYFILVQSFKDKPSVPTKRIVKDSTL